MTITTPASNYGAHPYCRTFTATSPQNASSGTTPTIVLTRRPKDSGSPMIDVWAPELHIVDGSWWFYFAGNPNVDPLKGSHRMYALRGPPASTDPMAATSKFTFEGLIRGMPNQWAIDGTVFYINQQLYMAWSGWPPNATDPLKQYLYITKMADPVTATGSNIISVPKFDWEKFSDPVDNHVHEINEGPAWLEIGTFKGIIYSASASWASEYKLAILQYNGGDPLQLSSWNKIQTPLLSTDPSDKGPFGPGHCSYYPGLQC
jgi:GH43 family beta-xylosidase